MLFTTLNTGQSKQSILISQLQQFNFEAAANKMLSRLNATLWLVKILTLLGFIPDGKSKARVLSCFLFWIAVQLVISLLFFAEAIDRHANIKRKSGMITLDDAMLFFANYINSSLHHAGMIIGLTYPWRISTPLMTSTAGLKAPVVAWPFLLIIVFLQIFNLYSSMRILNYTASLCASVVNYCFLSLVGLFVVGVYAAQMDEDPPEDHMHCMKSALKVATEKIAKFKAIKCFLSPLLFVILSTNGTIVLAASYSLFSYDREDRLLMLLPPIMVASTNIIYVCYAANYCYMKYKSVIADLRFSFFLLEV